MADDPNPGNKNTTDSTAIVDLDGEITEVPWPAGKKLLYAMLDAGLDAPHGCTQGQCGACQCVVEPQGEGVTHMETNNVLDDYDIADDMRLACQTLADKPDTYEISYIF